MYEALAGVHFMSYFEEIKFRESVCLSGSKNLFRFHFVCRSLLLYVPSCFGYTGICSVMPNLELLQPLQRPIVSDQVGGKCVFAFPGITADSTLRLASGSIS